MASPTEDDLRVADEVLMNTMFSTSVHFMLRSRIVSAIAAEREKAAKPSVGIRAIVSAAVNWRYCVHASLPESRKLARIIDANLEEAQQLIAD